MGVYVKVYPHLFLYGGFMIDKINEQKEKLKIEYENTIIAMRNVKEQIQIFNKKGEELAAHLNYTKGAMDILDNVTKDDENV
jgi:hypothetical protein